MPAGARDDRRFLLVDADGRLYNGKRDTTLVRARADWDAGSGVLTVILPTGEALAAEVAYGEGTSVEIFGRVLSGRVVVGPWADGLSELAGRALILVERDEGGWATDGMPASLVARASLDAFTGDGRRFRMMFELEGLEAYGEDAWRGQRLSIGEAVLLVGDPAPRCVVPSADPDTGVREGDMLREILAVRGPIDGQPCLGVFADVAEPGTVRVGDAVEVL